MPKASPRARKDVKTLHGAMVDLFTLMNEPQRDDTLLKEAGVSLDRALFPLLVGIEQTYAPDPDDGTHNQDGCQDACEAERERKLSE